MKVEYLLYEASQKRDDDGGRLLGRFIALIEAQSNGAIFPDAVLWRSRVFTFVGGMADNHLARARYVEATIVNLEG